MIHSTGGVMGRKRVALMVVFALILAGLITIRPPVSVAAGPTIVAQNFSFVGPNGTGDVTISVGTTVTWTNGGGTHTTTSDAVSPLWNAPLGPGEQFMFTFTQAGSFPYHCAFHGGPGFGMHGTITVVAAPPTPTGLQVTGAGFNSVTWSWTNVDPMANVATSDGTTITGLAPGTTSFTKYGVAYGGYACLSLSAYNSVGASAWTAYVCGLDQPITPYNPHTTGATTSTVSFGWSNFDTASYIALSNYMMVTPLGQNVMTSTQTGVASGYYVCVSVAAYNAMWASAWSGPACGYTLPTTPNLPVATPHAGSVSFVWTNHDPYSYIALTNGGAVQALGQNATTYTQTGMSAGQYACIKVAAYNFAGASAYTATWACGQAT